MHGYLEFERWYVGGFLAVFGLFIVWKGATLGSCSHFFCLELRDRTLRERFAPVVERRNLLEGDNGWARRITGLSAVLFGVLVLVRTVNPVIGYALLCAVLAIVTSQIYLSMRNRSEHRAASLQPRTATTSVPALWYAGAVLSAILPLATLGYPNLRISAIIVAIACTAIVIVAARTAKMAALLAGDDPEIEVYVDNRLRWTRVTGLLELAYAASYLFVSMSKPELPAGTPSVTALFVASWVLFFGFAIWAIARYFLQRPRANALVRR